MASAVTFEAQVVVQCARRVLVHDEREPSRSRRFRLLAAGRLGRDAARAYGEDVRLVAHVRRSRHVHRDGSCERRRRDDLPLRDGDRVVAVAGGGTAGVMIYGISLLVGSLGSAHLPTMAAQLAQRLGAGAEPGFYLALLLGGLMLMVGIAFKLSAVPFHFWIPDVFEGATAEVAAFLSIVKLAVLYVMS